MPSKFRALFHSRESRPPRLQLAASPSTPERSGRLSSQAGPPQDPPIQLPQSSGGPASVATNSNAYSVPIGNGQNYGIQVLHDAGPDACVDIVFVHGLTGNAYDTWLHKGTGIHWPSELLKQDLSDTRILSFGYDADIVNFWNPASNSRLSNHAEDLVGDLVRERERTDTETRKILFVAHSLGGLVTEYALSHSRNTAEEHLRQFERCTAGMVFLGVPHYGSDLASWGKFGTRMVGTLRRANKDIVGVLEPGSEMLHEVQKGFHIILRLRRDERSEISITCFFEELPVSTVGEIVPLHSAEIKGYSCYGIHANHMDMTKFPNRNDRGYSAVLGELRRWKKTVHGVGLMESHQDRITGGQSSMSANSIDHQPVIRWKMPRVSPLYTGRRELGERLTAAFSFDPSAPPVQQRIFVIIGIGGTGKSEVCAKFANDHEDEYLGVFWLDGSNVSTAEQGIIDIGRQCGITEPNTTTVKSWLACRSQRWLLIIDNADNPTVDYSDYMPSSKRGDILLTTRNPDYVAYQTAGSELLRDLEIELAQELLFKATSIPESRWKEKGKAAVTVIETLGSHTLAIVQAGAFVRRKLCSLEEYPMFFQQQKEQLLKFHSEANLSTYGNVYATFEVSAEYLQRSELLECMDALNLLHDLAFMHNDRIAETLFQRASDYAAKLKNTSSRDEGGVSMSARHIVRLPEYLQRGWSNNLQVRLRWRKACAMLESLSLITMHEDNESVNFSSHPLIHAWAKERQDHQSRCIAWQSAATTLALSCEGWGAFHPFFLYLQPHIRACIGHDTQNFTSSISDTEAAQLLLQLANVLHQTGDFNSLDSLIQKIRLRLQDRHVIDQALRDGVKTFTAGVYYHKGDYGAASRLFRDVFEGQVRRLAEDDPKRLDSQSDLAMIDLVNGQIKDAVELLEHVVKVREKLTEDHPNRLASQHELASTYLENKQIDEAIELFEHVVKIRKEKLAGDHPHRLASQHELARAYLANKQIDQAIELFEHVVKIDAEKLTGDHPHRLTSQHSLACAYLANRQIDDAIELFEHVVKIRKEKLAEDHPNRLASEQMLAYAYEAREEAEDG